MLAGVVRSSLGSSERYNFGKLVNEGLGNSASQVQENIMGNIETVLVSAVVSMYLFTAVVAAYFESKLPVNSDSSKNCQQCELDLDYVQFKCIVQVEKLAVKMTRQQGGLKLDYVRFRCVVQLEEPAVIVIRQQGGLYLDSGWTTPGE